MLIILLCYDMVVYPQLSHYSTVNKPTTNLYVVMLQNLSEFAIFQIGIIPALKRTTVVCFLVDCFANNIAIEWELHNCDMLQVIASLENACYSYYSSSTVSWKYRLLDLSYIIIVITHS